MAKIPTEADVRDVLKRFPLYHPGHKVIISSTELIPGAIIVSYRTNNRSHNETTHLSLQFQGDTCYIVGIGLDPCYRGAGLGEELYRISENIARQAGSSRVVMTPSGKTATEETRLNYVKRKFGYTEISGSFEVEKIL